MIRLVVFLAWIFHFSFGVAQQGSSETYARGYFRNPLGIPISLSGNFGELRSNHYHMGLDLRTNRQENLPVYSAADGYVARIKIEPGGFGRALYVNHPNGFTTVYAHLNNFKPELEKWVKDYQYQAQSWKIFPDLDPNLFPVKKGEFLAYSGNTGGSQAPHLHFEIRRTENDVNVNPLLFGLPLTDRTTPRILRMAVYDRTKSVFEQTPRILTANATSGSTYSVPLTTVTSPLISFALTSFDTHSNSSNLNGIFQATLYWDDEKVISFTMDNISYDDTRYLNAHIDYRYRVLGGSYLQHLSELPGYLNSIYQKFGGNGVIHLTDTAIHSIRFEVKDAYGNSSTLSGRIRYRPSSTRQPGSDARIYRPLMLEAYESDDLEFFIGEECLYDSVHIRHNHTASTSPDAVSRTHTIGASHIPLHEPILIRIRPERELTDLERQRSLMQWVSGGRKSVQKVEWNGQWASAWYRDFGSFNLVVDDTPPVIFPIGFSNGSVLSKTKRLVFTVRDNYQRIKNVRAELDGSWIRFSNDKGRNYVYWFDEKFPKGNHTLRITAEDEAGNVSEASYKLSR